MGIHLEEAESIIRKMLYEENQRKYENLFDFDVEVLSTSAWPYYKIKVFIKEYDYKVKISEVREMAYSPFGRMALYRDLIKMTFERIEPKMEQIKEIHTFLNSPYGRFCYYFILWRFLKYPLLEKEYRLKRVLRNVRKLKRNIEIIFGKFLQKTVVSDIVFIDPTYNTSYLVEPEKFPYLEEEREKYRDKILFPNFLPPRILLEIDTVEKFKKLLKEELEKEGKVEGDKKSRFFKHYCQLMCL